MNTTDISKNVAFLARRVGSLEKKVEGLSKELEDVKSYQLHCQNELVPNITANQKYVMETLAKGREAFHDLHGETHRLLNQIIAKQ